MIRKTAAFLFVCLCTSAWGQVPAKQTIVIKAGRLFDARSGRMLANHAIRIEGDRITEVGDAAAVVSRAPLPACPAAPCQDCLRRGR